MNKQMLMADFDCLSDTEFFEILQCIVDYAGKRFPGLSVPAMLSLGKMD